jgi:hypothetical protein
MVMDAEEQKFADDIDRIINKMILQRHTFESIGIYGTLSMEDGSWSCVTLEHAFDDGDGNFVPALNTGTHTCVLGTHQLDHGGPFQTYMVTDTPGHTGILIHVGNYNSDSDGCVLVGETRTGDMITNSQVTWNSFMNLMNNSEQFTLEVR